jgi:hypothetical protein
MIVLKYVLVEHNGKYYIGNKKSKDGLVINHPNEMLDFHYLNNRPNVFTWAGHKTANILDSLKTKYKKYDSILDINNPNLDKYLKSIENNNTLNLIIGGIKTFEKCLLHSCAVFVSIIQDKELDKKVNLEDLIECPETLPRHPHDLFNDFFDIERLRHNYWKCKSVMQNGYLMNTFFLEGFSV